ncbi:divalent metal cation transporter [Caldiplasma sukawensis]
MILINTAKIIKKLMENKTVLFFGPAWLAMMSDMDVSSYIGAAQTGALFGYGLIWYLILLIIPLYIVQELAGKISIIGKGGLGTILRINYGKKTASLASFPMALTDMVTYIIEYLGMAVGLEIIGIPIIVSIPIIYAIHILIVTGRNYRESEKILIMISIILSIALCSSLFLRGLMPLNSKNGNPLLFENTSSYFLIFAADLGAVIMPFMLFFQASATGKKLNDLKLKNIEISTDRALKMMKRETLIGAMVTEMLMVVAEMAFTGISSASRLSLFSNPYYLGKVLTPVAGKLSPYILSIGLISTGFLALITISLGSAWGVGEALDLPQKYYWIIYTVESLPAIIIVISINPSLLINYVLYLLVFFVFALITPMVMMFYIGKNENIMGAYSMKKWEQFLYIFILVAIISMGILGVIL